MARLEGIPKNPLEMLPPKVISLDAALAFAPFSLDDKA
jgi:hypothetical protein